jgi:hypothetical protein
VLPSVITYRMDGPLLVVTKSGTSTPQERTALFDTLRADPAVPNGAVLLLDMRDDEDALEGTELGHRFLGLKTALGLKLGPACAVVVHDQHDGDARTLRTLPAAQGLCVVMVRDEAVARAWLRVFVQPINHTDSH